MTQTKHTPGPWNITSRAGYTGHGINHGSKRVCSINSNSPLPKEERDANARLIAAAPDMLNVLLMFKRTLDGEDKGFGPEVLEALYAAIAKAEGQND